MFYCDCSGYVNAIVRNPSRKDVLNYFNDVKDVRMSPKLRISSLKQLPVVWKKENISEEHLVGRSLSSGRLKEVKLR